MRGDIATVCRLNWASADFRLAADQGRVYEGGESWKTLIGHQRLSQAKPSRNPLVEYLALCVRILDLPLPDRPAKGAELIVAFRRRGRER